jgi:nuclease S1
MTLARRSWLAPLLCLLACLQDAPSAWAWGRAGRHVVGRFAEARLTPRAKAAIESLLEPGESLADASTWADENRRKLPRTASWHYVDVPIDEPRYDPRFSGETASKGCIVDKIHETAATLAATPVANDAVRCCAEHGGRTFGASGSGACGLRVPSSGTIKGRC